MHNLLEEPKTPLQEANLKFLHHRASNVPANDNTLHEKNPTSLFFLLTVWIPLLGIAFCWAFCEAMNHVFAWMGL